MRFLLRYIGIRGAALGPAGATGFRHIARDLPLKAASLVLACLLWFVIAAEQTSEVGLSVPVELRNVPRDLELTGDAVNSVDVRLRASPGVVHQLGPGQISAFVELAGSGEGERIIHLTPEAFRVPFGVQIVKINPAILTLNFERTLLRVVPVRPRVLGRPAPGYEVAEIASEPAEVSVAGPKSRVQEVESAFTEPISVEGATASVVEQVTIGLPDPLLRIEGNPRARASVRIREAHAKRAFDDLSLGVRGGGASVRPARVRVVLTGPASVIGRVRPSDVRPYVDVTALRGRPGPAPVSVELAPGHAGVSVYETEPAEVAVRPRKGA